MKQPLAFARLNHRYNAIVSQLEYDAYLLVESDLKAKTLFEKCSKEIRSFQGIACGDGQSMTGISW